MTSQGSAVARLKRSLDNGHLMMAELAARELPRVPLVEALRFCLLMNTEDDQRYGRAVARWIARFVIECPHVGVDDLNATLDALEAMPDQTARDALVAVLARHGLVLRL